MDDTYLLMRPDKVRDGLEAVSDAFGPSGAQVNLSKSKVWCSIAVDIGTSGIQQTAETPQILKQPLPTVVNEDLFYSDAATDKVKENRKKMFDRLVNLKAAGLPGPCADCYGTRSFCNVRRCRLSCSMPVIAGGEGC